MILIKDVLLIQYSYTKIIFRKIKFIFGLKKFTFKTENVQFLTSQPQVVFQGIRKSFEGAHWDSKTIKIHRPHYDIP